ncbi:MAG: pyruvate formate lyase family protein, partial [Thermoguttaceae bacterium]
MNERVERLRQESYETPVTLSTERARWITEFYRENFGRYSVPVMRARAFAWLYEHQTLYLGDDELIVGERGPRPKAVSTYPELTCHSADDLRILSTREKTPYLVTDADIERYEREIIPFWRGRTMRERIFEGLPDEWKDAYEAGIFTEFMEQRAPGHTTLDGKFYARGLRDFQANIAEALDRLDFLHDPEATAKREELQAMHIACDAVIRFAQRHAELAEARAAEETHPERRKELERIAATCRRVPAHAPRTFREALQMYWFMHLGTITELNGWDAMNPGHLDRYFHPFYQRDLASGELTEEEARELLQCFWI